MKKLAFVIVLALFFMSCENSANKKSDNNETSIDTTIIDKIEKKAEEVQKETEELNKEIDELTKDL
jgi:peptidoglycan hydrolase CwlO-like protein